MKSSNTTLILGWMFLIGSFISFFGVFIICSSIFFAANFVIEEIQKSNKK